MNIKKKTLHLILTICTACGTVIAAAGLNLTYKIFNSTRDIWYGSDTLSSRTEIWSSIFDIVKEIPQTLIYGLPINKSTGVINSFVDLSDTISNLHNGYLQTLIIAGLPGFLMVIAFCIYLLIAFYRLMIANITTKENDISVKFMIIIPVCCLVMNTVESLIFFNPVQADILNLIFALFSGYIIEYAYHQEQN
jgi:O-antigen ligase